MRRLMVDHEAGKSGRGATLTDPTGLRVLGLISSWGVTNEAGRTVLFLAPDFGGIVRAGLVGGILDGVLGMPADSSPRARGPGEGRQVVKRANPPAPGMPPRWTPVATVTRERTAAADPTAYTVEMHEPLPAVRFMQRVDAATLHDVDNGYGDRREGVFDLEFADGRPILRHWATIDRQYRLRWSTFDVEETEFPLAEAVVLCLARFLAWRS